MKSSSNSGDGPQTIDMNLTVLKMKHHKEKVTKAINKKVNKLLQPRSVDHVNLIEDHLESSKSPIARKNNSIGDHITNIKSKKNQTPGANNKSVELSTNQPWGRKEALAAQREKQVRTSKLDTLRAELKSKIEALKNKRMSKTGKTPQKKYRESKKVRREKNRNKSGLGSERSDSKNKHKLMKLAASKIANKMSNHQLLVDESDSD